MTRAEIRRARRKQEIRCRIILFGALLAIIGLVVSISMIVSGKGQSKQPETVIEIEKNIKFDELKSEPQFKTTEKVCTGQGNETAQDTYIKFQDRMSMDWDADDAYLLAKIAMAEAESESTETKALVILTVLNRMLSDEFPNNIHDVIFQKNQFSPITNGRWDRVEPNEDCWKALDMIYEGYDESQGCLYFEACTSDDNWHSRNLQFLFEIDSVRFYK